MNLSQVFPFHQYTKWLLKLLSAGLRDAVAPTRIRTPNGASFGIAIRSTWSWSHCSYLWTRVGQHRLSRQQPTLHFCQNVRWKVCPHSHTLARFRGRRLGLRGRHSASFTIGILSLLCQSHLKKAFKKACSGRSCRGSGGCTRFVCMLPSWRDW